MAFNASRLRCLTMGGIASVGSTAGQLNGGGIWRYETSDPSTAVLGVAGYFAGCGRQPTSGYSAMPLAKSSNAQMALGDLVAVVQNENSTGTIGQVTWGAVKASTFNQASTSGSSAFISSAGFDITIASTT